MSGTATDPEGASITYSWSLTSKPSSRRLTTGTTLPSELGGRSSSATFSPDVPGVFVLTLTVEDAGGEAGTDEVLVIAERPATPDRPPIVNIGGDTLTKVGTEIVTLGAASDPRRRRAGLSVVAGLGPGQQRPGDGTPAGCAGGTWAHGAVHSRRTAPLPRDLCGRGQATSQTIQVQVAPRTTTNNPPAVIAGTNRSVLAGPEQSVDLQGLASDPDGDALTYSWTVVSAPFGSTVPPGALPEERGGSSLRARLPVNRAGLYVLALTATDSEGASASNSVQIIPGDHPAVPSALRGEDRLHGDGASLSGTIETAEDDDLYFLETAEDDDLYFLETLPGFLYTVRMSPLTVAFAQLELLDRSGTQVLARDVGTPGLPAELPPFRGRSDARRDGQGFLYIGGRGGVVDLEGLLR